MEKGAVNLHHKEPFNQWSHDFLHTPSEWDVSRPFQKDDKQCLKIEKQKQTPEQPILKPTMSICQDENDQGLLDSDKFHLQNRMAYGQFFYPAPQTTRTAVDHFMNKSERVFSLFHRTCRNLIIVMAWRCLAWIPSCMGREVRWMKSGITKMIETWTFLNSSVPTLVFYKRKPMMRDSNQQYIELMQPWKVGYAQ